MTSRNWVKLFTTTLVVGGITSIVVGFLIRWSEFIALFSDVKVFGIIMTFVWLFGIGVIFSIISQMGFFAYLAIHRLGVGIFRSVSLWNTVQLLLIKLAIFDLIYFRYRSFAGDGESLLMYILPAALIFAIGLIVTFMKVKETNKTAFIPTMFFMVAITIVELIPALRQNDPNWLYLMLFTLIVCNSYQILTLHKINEKSAQERALKATQKTS